MNEDIIIEPVTEEELIREAKELCGLDLTITYNCPTSITLRDRQVHYTATAYVHKISDMTLDQWIDFIEDEE